MIDVETYGAAVGAAKRYTDEHSGSDDAVKYTEQTLTDAQKTQARTNIGAGTSSFSGRYSDLTDAPPLVKGTGTGGNTVGGTGGTAMNSAKNLNSYAYGYLAGAYANYAFAFGDRAFAGNSNRNTGKHAVAIGNNVSAEKDYEIAYGKFNKSNADTAFSIGDGTSDSDRHNLIELKTDGTLLLNGNAVKTEGGDDDDEYYPMLGQVYKSVDATSGFVYGFKAAISGGYSISNIIFQSDSVGRNYSPANKFGDFHVYHSTSASQTTMYVYVPMGVVVDTSHPWIHVQNGFWMFRNCPITADVALGISNFDTSRVKNMFSMFESLTSGTVLDLSNFDTSKVKVMTRMFNGCATLTSLDLSSFDMTNVIEYTDMFTNDTALTTLKTPKINPHDDIPLPRTLYSQDGTAYTNLPVTTGASIELRASWT